MYLFILPASVILISTLDLLYKPATKAEIHKELAKKFVRLDMEMVKSEDVSDSKAAELLAKKLEIDLDEPPDLEIANVLSHNELCEYLDSREEIWDVGWFRGLVAQWLDVPPPKKWAKLYKLDPENGGSPESSVS